MSKAIIAGHIRRLSAPRWQLWITGNKRAKAALELAAIGSSAVPELASSLSGPGAAYAVLALKKIGKPAVPACLRELNGPGAAYALLFFDRETGAPVVKELIGQFGGEGDAYASLALQKIGPAALPPLMEAMENADDNTRMWAALTLGEMGTWAEQAVPVLKRKAEQDDSEDVREAAKIALEKIRN